MSLEKVRPGVWRVRWREGGRNRSKVVGGKRDAERFDAEIRRQQRLGGLGLLEMGEQRLSDFIAEWWELHAKPSLRRSTLELYARLLDDYIDPRLGSLRLRELSQEAIQRFRVDLEHQGVGPVVVAKALTLLHGILERAVEWGRLSANPARSVRKPAQRGVRPVRPLVPEQVEAIRADLLGRSRFRDAALVSVLAYAGLRPGEALALTFGALRERTLLVESAVSLGELGDTKTRRHRTVRLLGPLAQDLAEWALRCGRPGVGELVFSKGRNGGPWSASDWGNWRRRIYAHAARAAGAGTVKPYALRHSFASLLIQEGLSVVEVAAQLGHSPQVTLSTYAHVFDELEPGDRRTAEERIRQARDLPVEQRRTG